MNKPLLEIQEIAMKLKKLKEKEPSKFYEFKGIVDTVHAIQTGKGIEYMLLSNINK